VLATCCVLLTSSLPTAEEADAVKRSLGQADVRKEAFVAVDFWCDATEASADREYSHPFARSGYIKEMLFDLHGQDGVLNGPRFVKNLRVNEIQLCKSKLQTYGDILRY